MDIIQEENTDNDIGVYTDEDLIKLQNIIENMEKTNQVKILHILNKKNVIINENKNGIHINLSEIQKPIIDELINFVNYINKQELMLSPDEKIKEDYKTNYF